MITLLLFNFDRSSCIRLGSAPSGNSVTQKYLAATDTSYDATLLQKLTTQASQPMTASAYPASSPQMIAAMADFTKINNEQPAPIMYPLQICDYGGVKYSWKGGQYNEPSNINSCYQNALDNLRKLDMVLENSILAAMGDPFKFPNTYENSGQDAMNSLTNVNILNTQLANILSVTNSQGLIGKLIPVIVSSLNSLRTIKQLFAGDDQTLRTTYSTMIAQLENNMPLDQNMLTLATVDGLKKLNKWQDSMASAIGTSSVKVDGIAGVDAQTIAVDDVTVGNLIQALNQSANTTADAGMAKLVSVYTNATTLVPSVIAAAYESLRGVVSELISSVENQMDLASKANLKSLNTFSSAASSQLTASPATLSASMQAVVNALQAVRTQAEAQVDASLKSNISELAQLGLILQPALTVAMTQLQSKALNPLLDLQSQISVTLANFQDTALDVEDLITRTVTNFQNVTSNFEQSWSDAQLAASGNSGSLSQSFINQLASVGADADAEVTRLQASGSAQQGQQQSEMASSQASLTASMSDVSDFMTGAAVQISGQTQSMQNLIVNKQASLNSTISLLTNFLKSRMQSGNISLSTVLSDLSAAVDDVASTAPDPSVAAAAQIANNAQQMNAQIVALMGAANISASTIQQLQAAALAGNNALFDSIRSQVYGANAGLAEVVQNATQAAVIAQQLTKASGSHRAALQNRLNELLGSSNNKLAMLRGAATSLSHTAVQSLSQLAASQESSFQSVADTAQGILTSIAYYPPQVPNELNVMMAPLVTESEQLQTKNVPEWIGIIQSVAPVISTEAQTKVDSLSGYETNAETDLNSVIGKVFVNSTANNTEFLASKLANFDSYWLATQNDTQQFWNNYLPNANGQAQRNIQALDRVAAKAESTATSLANDQTVATLMKTVNAFMASEVLRVMKQNNLVGSINIADYTASANDSVSYLNNLSDNLLKKVKQVFVDQVGVSDAAKARLIQAVHANAAEDDAFAVTRANAEAVTLMQAQAKYDALAPTISSSLSSNTTGQLATSLTSSMASLKTAQAKALQDSSAEYALELVRNASSAINQTSGSVADGIAQFATNTSKLQAQAFSGSTQNGLYAAADAMSVTGGAVGAAALTAGGLAGTFSRSVGDLLSQTEEQAGNAQQTVSISGDALQQLLQAFTSTQAAALATQSENNKAIAEQKASIVGILAMWSELIAQAINTSSSGYATISADNELLMDGLEAAAEAVTSNVSSTISTAEATADAALTAVEDFKKVKSALITSLTGSLLKAAASEKALTTQLNKDGSDLNATIAQLNSTDSSAGSDIQSDLDQWASDFRQAVSSDLISLAQR